MIWATLFFLLSLLVLKSLYQAVATGTIGIRRTTYSRETEPASFWMATVLHLVLLVAALTIAMMSLRNPG